MRSRASQPSTGTLRFSAGDAVLLEDFNISVADVACFFGHLMAAGEMPADRETLFRQGDDALELSFRWDGENIVIRSNASEGSMLSVHADDFAEGARRFVRSFATEAGRRVPGVFHWKDMRTLERWAVPERAGSGGKAEVRLVGWRAGLKKVSLNKLIQQRTGAGLRAAKDCVDDVLEDRIVVLTFESNDDARSFAEAAETLGAICQVHEGGREERTRA